MYEKVSREMMEFIQKSPSCYHVVQNFCEMLGSEGYQELQEENKWRLEKGGKYYITRNDSSLIAFQIPDGEIKNFQIAASHSDSPSFKVKENPDIKVDGHYVELNTEKYGGMICAPWFDRPLSVAGKAVVRSTDGVCSRLVHIDRDLVMIPNVAIHMNHKLNDGYTYNAQKDMIPLFGDETAEGSFRKLLAENLGVPEEDILSTDLFLYTRMPGTVWGANREFISCTRLDDLQCAYASIRGLLAGGHPESISVCCVFDNEEVGSGTKQGAASTMMQDVLERICICLGKDREEYKMLVANSFMLSADNAHAVHPHHLDKADPTNRPYMNRGVVIKYNANQKYTTDSVSAAVFQEICRKAGVPVQSYVNRSDVPGGSTLGNIANRQVSLNTVDIGLPQLAMHSPYETAGIRDTWYLIQAVTAFYSTAILKADGQYKLLF
ncbi:MAG: M18 family aminopeptidase [Lachnospiraceae bacterium]|nr:M18 family aminopeptidase [Lachnospiraceae bacterium]